jgi:hypothetical protein
MTANDAKGGPLGVGAATRRHAIADCIDMAAPPLTPRPLRIKTEPEEVIPDLNRTAIVVIDMQNDFCAPGGWVNHIGGDYRPDRAPIEPLQGLLPDRAAQGCR